MNILVVGYVDYRVRVRRVFVFIIYLSRFADLIYLFIYYIFAFRHTQSTYLTHTHTMHDMHANVSIAFLFVHVSFGVIAVQIKNSR